MDIINAKCPELEKMLISILLKERVEDHVQNLLLPAGGTPEVFYKEVRENWFYEFQSFKLWQIDDVLNGPQKDCFHKFFKDHLGSLFSNLTGPKEKMIEDGVSYSSFLGLGVNGHVAFHEPHIPHNFSFGCVELGRETLDYLSLKEGTWGITYGLGTFLKSNSIYMLVKGLHKKDILKRFLEDDPSVPAVELKKHKRLVLMVEDELWNSVINDV